MPLRSIRNPHPPSRPRALLALLGLGVAVLLFGCRTPADSVGGSPAPFDAAPFASGIDALEQVLTGEAWSSFARLGREFALPPTASATSSPSGPGSAPVAVPVIPQPYRGATLVHDGQGYVVDAQRAGAPADGLRFILYSIAEGTGQPLLAAEIGHTDLRDVGSDLAMGFAVAVEVVGPAGTVAEYMGSFGLEEAAGRAAGDVVLFDHFGVELAGRITLGTGELEFEIVTGARDGLEITDADLRVNGEVLIVTGVIGANGSTGEVDVDLSLVADGDSLRLSGHADATGFEGSVRLNGDPVAVLTNDSETEVEPAGSLGLGDRQIALLERLPRLVDLLFDLVDVTAEPIELD